MGFSEVGLDRREFFRAHYIADVEIERGDATLPARTTNISLGGMLLDMENPLWIGAEFHARVRLGDGERLEVDCVVRRILPREGMGVEFLELKPADQVRLRKLLESLPH